MKRFHSDVKGFCHRLSEGPDIMSVPALSSYLQASLSQVFLSAMTWCAGPTLLLSLPNPTTTKRLLEYADVLTFSRCLSHLRLYQA